MFLNKKTLKKKAPNYNPQYLNSITSNSRFLGNFRFQLAREGIENSTREESPIYEEN